MPNLAAWRMVAYAISQDPDSYRPRVACEAATLCFTLDARKLAWLAVGMHDGTGKNGLCWLDFQPIVLFPAPELSLKQLKSIEETAKKQKVPASSMAVPKCDKHDMPLDPIANATYIDFFLTCVTRMLNAFSWASGLDRAGDTQASIQATREHLLNSANRSSSPPFWHLIQVVSLALDDPSKRLNMASRNPNRCYLTNYERVTGGSIRLVAAYNCELVIRHTQLAQE